MNGSSKGNKQHAPTNNTPLFILVACLVVGMGYLIVLNASFVLDDFDAVLRNPHIGDVSYLWGSPLDFLRRLFLFIPYTIGGATPFWYHILNILFHIGTVIFIFLTVKLLFDDERYAWITALLFAVHPILVESVTWISSLPVPQYSFFFMVSLYCYIRAFDKGTDKKWYGVSLGAFLLSLLSSERAASLPFVLLLLELSFYSLKKQYKYILPYFLILLVIGALTISHLGARSTSLNASMGAKTIFTNPLIHIPYSVTEYLKIIAFPVNFTIYHTPDAMVIPKIIVRSILFLAFLAGIIYMYFRNRVIFFWGTFFLIVLAPTLIPLSIVWMVAERYVYLSVLGIIGIFAYPLFLIAKHKKYSIYVYIAVAILILVLVVRTFIRNLDWQNPDTLWISTVQTSPNSQYAHNNIGGMYLEKQDYKRAISEFIIAIKLQPDYADAYYNLGVASEKIGDLKNAEQSFIQSYKYNPNLWEAHERLSIIYFNQKKYDRAADELNMALKINPHNAKLKQKAEILKQMR